MNTSDCSPELDFVEDSIAPQPLAKTGLSAPFFHVTRARSKVLQQGFKPPNALSPSDLAFGHAGVKPNYNRISLTNSIIRVKRYRSVLLFLSGVAKGRVLLYEAFSFMLAHAGRTFVDLLLDMNDPEAFGTQVCMELPWLSEDERWSMFADPPVSPDQFWRDACGMRADADVWNAVFLLERIEMKICDSGNTTLGLAVAENAISLLRESFAALDEDEVAIFQVELRNDSVVDFRPEEEEVQVLPDDILSFYNVDVPAERWSR